MPAIEATIANAGTTSNAVDVGSGPLQIVGLVIPALTASTAVTFTVANKATDTFVPLYDDAGDAVSAPASTSAARAVSLQPYHFAGWRFVKCVVADAQTGAKVIEVVLR